MGWARSATAKERDAGAWERAERQQGLVTRRDLLALGFGQRSIEHRVACGRLHRVAQGVYAVGWPGMTQRRRWMAAVLACGEGAVLSHRSAAALWGIAAERPGPVSVLVPRRCTSRRKGIRLRGRPGLAERDVAAIDGIPVTGLVSTLLDMTSELLPARLRRGSEARERRERQVKRLVNEADKRGLIDPEALRAELEQHRGVPGVRPLSELLDRATFLLSDSELEERFQPIAKAAGLPRPLSKQVVNGYEVDFHWPELGLVVETDGLTYHRTPFTQSDDARRDQTHTASGLTTLRFSHYQVRYERRHVREMLRKTAKHLR